MYYVYVIQNQVSQKMYIGHTEDLTKRLARHNKELPNKLTSYTSRNKGKWKVVYKKTYNTRVEALKREKQLKSHKGRDWIKKYILGP